MNQITNSFFHSLHKKAIHHYSIYIYSTDLTLITFPWQLITIPSTLTLSISYRSSSLNLYLFLLLTPNEFMIKISERELFADAVLSGYRQARAWHHLDKGWRDPSWEQHIQSHPIGNNAGKSDKDLQNKGFFLLFYCYNLWKQVPILLLITKKRRESALKLHDSMMLSKQFCFVPALDVRTLIFIQTWTILK